ncbi:MAG: chromate reductase, NAD(P)H dehydrogenase (quinone) [Methyloprofundus sp.]|nr:MAG: chromate reductase, NAD(P)H dehydrogenase (quinone) [Methyloprofundus sp.]
MSKILFLSGSARAASLNKKLAKLAAEIAAAQGASVTFIDLKDFEMPLYNGDLEAEHGIPENAKKLKQIFVEHDGFFIASPEYNSSFSALLKNTLDWLSRPHMDNEAPLIAYQGKVAALGAVSPGALGGMRGLVSLRMLLGNIRVTVIPTQVAVASGMQAFDAQGKLTDSRQAGMLQATIDELVKTTNSLSQ